MSEMSMTCAVKLKKLLEKYSLPDDATQVEVLRALEVHCPDYEANSSDLYSRKCQACAEQDDVGSGYD